jgi:hypothetical protein
VGKDIGNFTWGFVVRDSTVGLVTRYRLHGPGIEIPVGTIYPALVQTGPRSHPAFYKMGTQSSFLGVKRSGPSVDLPLLLALRLKKRRVIFVFSLWAFMTWSKVKCAFLNMKT